MNLSDYQALAIRTRNQKLSVKDTLLNACFGMIGEVGELADLFKKHRFHGHAFNTEKFADETGDCFWYAALYAHVLGWELVDIAIPSTDDRLLNMQSLGRSLLFASAFSGNLADIVNQGTYGKEKLVVPGFRFHFQHLLSELLFISRFSGGPMKVMERNISKLKLRYPEGFDENKSINRSV